MNPERISRILMRILRHSLPGLAAFGCAAILAVSLLIAQTTAPPKKKATRQAKMRQTATADRHRADSLASVRVDSLRRVAEKAAADSIRRRIDSLALVGSDSLKTRRFRKIDNRAFGVGERLVFNISYGVITAGEAVMAIPAYDSIAGRKCYRMEFKVNSLPSFSWIYKVEDRYLTFIDVETIAPLRFEQHIREGSYKRDFFADFDPFRNVAKTSEGEFPIPPYVHDIMSAFYYARTRDFSRSRPGDITTLYNFYKDKTYELGVKFLGRQKLELEAGTFNTIVVEPLVREGGLFKSEGRIVIWLTDDERMVPVRVNTKVVIGSIDVELREYSGLIGPLQARTK